MGNSRSLIRLIDVALIILLGFIAISRLKTEYVDLPSGSDPTKTPQEFHEVSLRLRRDSFVVSDGGRKSRFSSIDDLENALRRFRDRYQARNQKLMVNIESSRAVIVQTLIDVIDICQRNEIQKNLDYVVFD